MVKKLCSFSDDEDATFWMTKAQMELNNALTLATNENVAKNVVLFLGDGMGISTVTAARILKGQLNGMPGEETVLAMETFPHVALSKVKLEISACLKAYTYNSHTFDVISFGTIGSEIV